MEKVLFLLKAREFGGMEVILLDWLSRIDYSKVSVAVCSYGTDVLWKRLDASGLPLQTIRLSVPDNQPWWKVLRKWVQFFSSVGPEKIVVMEGFVNEIGVVPVVAAWLRNPHTEILLYETNWGRSLFSASPPEKRKPRDNVLPGIRLYRHKETLKQRFRGSLMHHTFVMSSEIKNNLVSEFGYPAGKTSVLHHGVDIERFRPSPSEGLDWRRLNGIPSDATVAVSHGRLVRRKRVDRILKAFEVLGREYPQLWILLTCYGPLKEEIEALAARSAARERIKLVGFQSDPTAVLKAGDIYVLSSNDEGFGISLVEALAAGLISVATKGPGPLDILTDGVDGFLAEPNDQGVLLGMRRALELPPNERAEFVKRGRKKVTDRFEITNKIEGALSAMKIPAR